MRGHYVEIKGEKLDLVACAMELRMSANGSSDNWGPEEARAAVDHMKQRISNWDPPLSPRYAKFDDAVKELCLAAIGEFEGSWLDE